jgi:hypothetical protein
MAVKKSPETEASVMATRDSRPVREEVVVKVSVDAPMEPVVFKTLPFYKFYIHPSPPLFFIIYI